MKPYYQIKLFDKHGILKKDSGLVESHSFVIAFLKHIECAFRHTDLAGVTDTGNTSRTLKAPAQLTREWLCSHSAPATNDTYGVVVGTGTAAESNTSYALQTKIAHGTGAGQLEYQSQDYTAAAVDGANVDWQVRRTFHNDSGGAITIQEIGVYVQTNDSGATYRYFLILRDLATQAVANNETAQVKYILRTTA